MDVAYTELTEVFCGVRSTRDTAYLVFFFFFFGRVGGGKSAGRLELVSCYIVGVTATLPIIFVSRENPSSRLQRPVR